MTLAQRIDSWLAHSTPGQKIVYYEGELARDRTTDVFLDAGARRIALAESVGEVLLTQLSAMYLTRLGESMTFYIATRMGARA